MSVATSAGVGQPGRWGDVRAAGARVGLALAAGVVVGAVVGGVGGRIVMLVLRRASPGREGVTTDAGAEIGRVTLGGSLSLAVITAFFGLLFAVLYSAARLGMPAVTRLPAAVLLGGALGGTSFLDPEGLDLLILGPTWFAVASFIVLPAVAAGAIALALETLARRRPWPAALRPAPPRELVLVVRVLVTGSVALLIAAQTTELIDVVGRIP